MEVQSSYVGVVDGVAFLIDGVNVWRHEWRRVPGDHAIIRADNGQDQTVPIYRIDANGAVVTFAAHEISSCVWAFYLPKGHEYEAT